ncbi:MAG: ABC transporter permease [Planctomycetota bacterium]|jgi:lipoprotein-releasing system permease protein
MHIFYLAWKYAKCRLANIIAMLTIAICVFVQVVVMAVLDGMLIDYKNRIKNLGEQLRIELPFGANNNDVYLKLEAALLKNNEIKGITPVLQDYAMLNYYYSHTPAILRGIDFKKEIEAGNLGKYILDLSVTEIAEFSSAKSDNIIPPVILGARAAEMLGVSASDIIDKKAFVHVEFARGNDNKLVRQKFRIVSRFRSSVGFYDEYMTYIPIKTAQSIFTKDTKYPVNILSVWLKDTSISTESMQNVKENITKEASLIPAIHNAGVVRIKTAEDMWHSAFQGMAHENALMEVVMAFISFACGFAIFAIMYTLVSDRIRDIGIMRSIGYSRKSIALIFVAAGLVLGVAGSILGSVGGVLFAPHVSASYEFITGQPLYPPHLFGAKELYIHINYNFVIIRGFIAVAVAVLASLPAALWAGFRQPLEALRHE